MTYSTHTHREGEDIGVLAADLLLTEPLELLRCCQHLGDFAVRPLHMF